MDEKNKEEILHYYCDNRMANLRILCDKVLGSLGRNSKTIYDIEEYYSIALEELAKAINTYNPDNELGAKFNTFLSIILSRKFLSAFSKKNRKKRGEGIKMISLDEEMEDGNTSIIETIPSSINIEEEIIDGDCSDNLQNYLNTLSKKQKNLAELFMQGYTIENAKEEMNLSRKEMENMLKFMRSYERRMILNSGVISKGEVKHMKNQVTMEKSKATKMDVNALVKKMNNKTINFDHPLQRYAGQWSNKMKSDLISDIIQGNPIPALIFAEQIINGTAITFDLDGKQRCTTVKEFKEDIFKISKNVSRNIIEYQSFEKDEKGKPILDYKGYPKAVWKEYDIANKKYSQLPEELKDAIDSYNFEITLYLNCSDEDIAYHIQRYNQGKAMNGIQKGVTHLGEDFAREVKAITGLPFFQDNGFTFKQYNNGTIDRVVIESVMAVNFLDDWKKSPEEIATFLNKNADITMFENIEDSITRIEDVIADSDEVGELFNAKNTFLWLAVFERFKKFNLQDSDFKDFLVAFVNSLQSKTINGTSFKILDEGKNTKDKSILIRKIDHISNLMSDYFFNDNIAV